MKVAVKYVGEAKVTKSTKPEFVGKQLRTVVFEDYEADGEFYIGQAKCIWEDSILFDKLVVGSIVNI